MDLKQTSGSKFAPPRHKLHTNLLVPVPCNKAPFTSSAIEITNSPQIGRLFRVGCSMQAGYGVTVPPS